MAKLENLKPWRPGQSGNPGGRPKKKPLTALYEEMLNDGATLNAIRAAILKNIKTGKTAFIPLLREMADRVEGKITQTVAAEITGEVGFEQYNWENLSDGELQDLYRIVAKLAVFGGDQSRGPARAGEMVLSLGGTAIVIEFVTSDGRPAE